MNLYVYFVTDTPNSCSLNSIGYIVLKSMQIYSQKICKLVFNNFDLDLLLLFKLFLHKFNEMTYQCMSIICCGLIVMNFEIYLWNYRNYWKLGYFEHEMHLIKVIQKCFHLRRIFELSICRSCSLFKQFYF